MSSESSTPGLLPPPKIAIHAFVGFLWGGLAIGFLFYLMRIYVRIRSFRRLFWDDALVLVAWLMLLANAIIWQRAKTGLYLLLNVQSGRVPPPANFNEEVGEYLHLSLVVLILFYSSLWCIKLSFLVFFKRLGRNVRRQKTIWWSVLAVVVASYFSVIGTVQYHCLIPSFEEILQKCTSPSAKAFEHNTLRACCAIDILSDALIILVPLNMLWRVQISLRRKLGLAGIFSLTVFIMIIAIIRVTVMYGNRDQADGSWLWTWSSIEQTVAMIIVCLASFRALFTQQDRPRVPKASGNTDRALLHGNSKTKASIGLGAMGKVSTVVNTINTSSSSKQPENSSEEMFIAPMNGVHVRNDYYVISDVESPPRRSTD